MTDKQVIIDGVDVSKCEHSYISTSLFEEKTYAQCSAFFLENEDSYCDCEENPNCYYKQLIRKEQECEELKEDYNKLDKFRDHLMIKIRAMESADKFYAEDVAKKEFKLKEELDQLKQALTEIKEILNFYANSTIGEKQGNGTYKILLNGGCILNYDPKPAIEALKKISEVIDEG